MKNKITAEIIVEGILSKEKLDWLRNDVGNMISQSIETYHNELKGIIDVEVNTTKLDRESAYNLIITHQDVLEAYDDLEEMIAFLQRTFYSFLDDNAGKSWLNDIEITFDEKLTEKMNEK